MRVLGRLPLRPAQPPCLSVDKVSKDLLRCFVGHVVVQAKEGFANHE